VLSDRRAKARRRGKYGQLSGRFESNANAPPRSIQQPAAPRPLRRISAGWFVLASVLSGILGLLYLRRFVTRLDEDAAGALRAIFSALAGYAFLTTGMQVAFATQLLPGTRPVSLRDLRTISFTIAAGAAATAAGIALVWLPIGPGRVPVTLLTASYVLLSGFASLPRAQLLARRRWRALGFVALSGAAAKLAGSAILWQKPTLIRALVGLVAAEAIACGLAVFLGRDSPTLETVPREPTQPVNGRLIAISVGAFCGLWALTSIDSVVARVAMSASDADAYAASAAVARVVFVIPSIAIWLALPSFIENVYGSVRLRRVFRTSMAIVCAASLGVMSMALVAPAQFRRLLAEDQAANSDLTTRLLAVSWATFGAIALLTFFHVAHRSRFALAPWLGAIVVATSAFAVGGSATGLAVAVLVGGLVSVGCLLLAAVPRMKPVTHAIQADRQDFASVDPYRTDVSIVVPCYNPGPAVLETLNQLRDALLPATATFEVIAVSDGSTDGSDSILDSINEPWLRHINRAVNMGKGAALRVGFSQCHSAIIGFIDADGDLDPAQLIDFLHALHRYDADAVIGSKRHPDSTLTLPPLRKIYSRGYQSLVRVLFRLDIRDTQTGIKVFRREMIEAVLPLVQEDGFALDLEIFVAARASGFNRFVELPIVLNHQFNSNVSVRTTLDMFAATLRIFWAARMRLRYLRLVLDQPDQESDKRQALT
jgi:Glycosyl transferase family 2